MYKEVLEGNSKRRKQARKIQNARANVLPIKISVGRYVMIWTYEDHKCQQGDVDGWRS